MTDYYGNPNPSNFNWPMNNISVPMNNTNYWTPQLRTNKILVTSLEEAIAKSGERNSEMYYFDQSKPVIYVVKVDMNGMKSWAQLLYTTPNEQTNTPATKADIEALSSKLDNFVKSVQEVPKTVKRKKAEDLKTEVADDVESDG